MKKSTYLLFSALLMSFLFVGIARAEIKTSIVEGKVFDPYGEPLAGIKIIAIQKEPIKGYNKFVTKTRSDGSFSVKGLYPGSAYVITPEAVDSCNRQVPSAEMISAPARQVKLVKRDFIAVSAPLKVSRDGVISDPRTNLEWAPDSGRHLNWDQANQYAQTLDLAGGGWRLPTVKELHTIYAPDCAGHIIYEAFRLGKNMVWSSQLDGPSRAWTFDFNTGREDEFSTPLADPNLYYGTHVLVVRPRR